MKILFNDRLNLVNKVQFTYNHEPAEAGGILSAHLHVDLHQSMTSEFQSCLASPSCHAHLQRSCSSLGSCVASTLVHQDKHWNLCLHGKATPYLAKLTNECICTAVCK